MRPQHASHALLVKFNPTMEVHAAITAFLGNICYLKHNQSAKRVDLARLRGAAMKMNVKELAPRVAPPAGKANIPHILVSHARIAPWVGSERTATEMPHRASIVLPGFFKGIRVKVDVKCARPDSSLRPKVKLIAQNATPGRRRTA
jgi:hypothetical protein